MALYLYYDKRRTPLSGVGHYLERNHKVGWYVTIYVGSLQVDSMFPIFYRLQIVF